jgi:putative hydrolase of the HAD superfamily
MRFPCVADALARHGIAAEPEALARADTRARRRIDLAQTVGGTTDHQRGWLYFNLVLDEAGIDQDDRTDRALDDLQAYHRIWNLWEHVPADVTPALERFRALGLRVVVVSNANGKLRELFERIGLAPHFDLMLDSSVEGVEKPDPRLFQIALERSGAEAGSTLHAGDLYHVDGVGARAAGLHTVLIDPDGLYVDADCPRVTSLGALASRLEQGARHW